MSNKQYSFVPKTEHKNFQKALSVDLFGKEQYNISNKKLNGRAYMYFSKSKYCEFYQCSKIIWLDKYKPKEKEIDDSARRLMATGKVNG